MKKIILVLLLISASAYALEGPDFMLIGDLYVPQPNCFSFACNSCENQGIDVVFRNASLYKISSLNWIFAGASIHSKFGSLAVSFRDYGINELYKSTMLSLYLQKPVYNSIFMRLGYSRKEYSYGVNYYNSTSNVFAFGAGLKFRSFNLSAIIDNLAFKKESFNNNPELCFSLFWQADELLTFHAIYFNDNRKHDRLLFGQSFMLAKPLNFKAGILMKPDAYYTGFEIVYKRFVFGYTYFDIGGLPDCMRLTLSYR